MIAYLEGKIIEKDLESIILNVGGVGYFVRATPDLIQEIQGKEKISIWTYLAVRENALDLYGFKDKKELSVFKILLTISGVGPKSALKILSSTSAETLISGIQSEDASYLSKISGIGRKTAEKIVVALKDKLNGNEFNKNTNNETESDTGETQDHNILAIDALVALGYSERDARDTITKIKKEHRGKKPEDLIKEALKNFGRKNN